MAVDLKRIRRLREEKGITQAAASKKLGYISAAAYSRIETGARRLRADHLVALAELLEVTPTELLDTEMEVGERR